jgi:very-short-patch-repair endonuclease
MSARACSPHWARARDVGRYLGKCQWGDCRKAVWDDGDGYFDYSDRSDLTCLRHRPRPHVPESPIEDLFLRAWQAAFPDIEVIPQYPVPPYYLDLGLPRFMIGIELDGAAYHGGELKALEDRYRQQQIELSGWKLLRFTGSAVHASPDGCVREAGHLIAAELTRRWTSA